MRGAFLALFPKKETKEHLCALFLFKKNIKIENKLGKK